VQLSQLMKFSTIIIKNGFFHDQSYFNEASINGRNISEAGSIHSFYAQLKFGSLNQSRIFMESGNSGKVDAATVFGKKKEPAQENVVNTGWDNPGSYDAAR
jgi:hypothetical protein